MLWFGSPVPAVARDPPNPGDAIELGGSLCLQGEQGGLGSVLLAESISDYQWIMVLWWCITPGFILLQLRPDLDLVSVPVKLSRVILTQW